MARIRYRDDSSGTSSGLLLLAVGALAGITAGVLVAQRFGGLAGVSARVRDRLQSARGGVAGDTVVGDDARYGADDFRDEDEDEYGAPEGLATETFESADEELEERVLEAFHHDPILSERAVDIGAIGEGIIELTGWVHADEESEHAVTLTRGVPGVDTVVNRLAIRTVERQRKSNARRYAAGDPALTEARWEGQQVGIGKRRQGSSAEMDRHADPKPELEDRWMNEQHAIEAAADDIEGIAERRKEGKQQIEGDRTGGSPIAPSGVPKADHVADPTSPAARAIMKEETGRDTLRAD